MSEGLVDVEGVGPAYAATLAEHGMTTTDDLLGRAARPADRTELAAATGIDAALILEWVNHADLFRIHGVAGQFADLLEEAGVDTVVELAQRNPDNLASALGAANAAKNLANRVPSVTEVQAWVAEAKALPRAVFYDDADESEPAAAAVAAPVTPRLEAEPEAPTYGATAVIAPIVEKGGGGDERGWLDRLVDRIRGR